MTAAVGTAPNNEDSDRRRKVLNFPTGKADPTAQSSIALTPCHLGRPGLAGPVLSRANHVTRNYTREEFGLGHLANACKEWEEAGDHSFVMNGACLRRRNHKYYT